MRDGVREQRERTGSAAALTAVAMAKMVTIEKRMLMVLME